MARKHSPGFAATPPPVEYDEAVQTFTTQLPSGAGLTIRRTVSTPKPPKLAEVNIDIDAIGDEENPLKAQARLMQGYLNAGSAMLAGSRNPIAPSTSWSIEIKRMRTSMKDGQTREDVQTLTLDEREAPVLFSIIRVLLSLDGPAYGVGPL